MDNIDIDKINEFLLKKWDPIGISTTSGAEDEYFQYAFDIYKIIQRSKSYEKLFEYLWEIETQHMGLKGNKTKTEKFAELLFNTIKGFEKH